MPALEPRLLHRDTSELTRVSPELLRRTLDLLASQQASEFVAAHLARHLARHLGSAESSAVSYLDKLRALYLVEVVPAWSRSRTQRLVRKPKVIVADSGLCAELAGLDEETLTSPLGAVHLGARVWGGCTATVRRRRSV